MLTGQEIEAEVAAEVAAARRESCPVDHAAYGRRKGVAPDSAGPQAPRVARDAAGVWHVRGFEEARAVLRSNATRQAGFGVEQIARWRGLTNQPILFQDGKVHQEQRATTARFFTPKTVSARYRTLMERQAARLVGRLRRTGQADLSALSLTMAMQVAAQVVGLTDSPLRGLARRLDAFFAHPAPAGSRFGGAVRQARSLWRMAVFYWCDVRPAIRARRAAPREDVISHLLAQGYTDAEILIECVTYGAAGMATTREFIAMAAWHFLEQPALRARYLAAPEAERVALLHEILRLEPVISHVFRRATAAIPLPDGQVIPAGARIDLAVETANLDPRVVDPDVAALCPARPIHASRASAMLLSFGDGAHRCPGAYLAIQETDIFLRRLLALPGLRLVRPPTLTWNPLTQGYELRGFLLAADRAS